MLRFQPYNVVTNLSNYQLNRDEMDLLKNGLEFLMPPRFFKENQFCQFDMIAKFMTQELDDSQISTRLKNKLSQMANSYVYKYTPSLKSLKKHKILQKIKCNKDIVITHQDKGNDVIILNRDEYLKGMTELVSDQQKFKKLKQDPTSKREEHNNGLYVKLIKRIYLVILNIQIYILKELTQLNFMEHLKYARLSYQVLFLLFDLFSLQSVLLTTILLSN